MNKNTQTIGLFYGLSGLNKLGYAFFIGTYAVFLKNRGMDEFAMNLINSVYYLVIIGAEIPTGAVADLFGRRKSFVLAAMLYTSAMATYYLSHSFTWFVIAEVLAALGATFWSGTFQAWLVDRLQYGGYEKPLFRVFARASQIDLVMGIAGALAGGYVANRGLGYVWLIAGAIFLFCGILAAFFMKEEYLESKTLQLTRSLAGYGDIVKSSIRISASNPTVRFLILLGLALYFAEQAPKILYQSFFRGFLTNTSDLGWLRAGMLVVMVIGAQGAVYLVAVWKDVRSIIVLTLIVMGAAIALTGMMPTLPYALAAFLTFQLVRGAFKPLADTLINSEIPSRERATVLSFASMVFSVGGWAGLVLSGYLAKRTSIPFSWLIFGTLLVACSAPFVIWARRSKKAVSETITTG